MSTAVMSTVRLNEPVMKKKVAKSKHERYGNLQFQGAR